MSRPVYIRKTEGERREPGGLERAVLMLLVDGFRSNFEIAAVLETSTQNINNAFIRLEASSMAYADRTEIPFKWFPSNLGRNRYLDDTQWL